MKNIELTNNHCTLCPDIHCTDLKDKGRQVITSTEVRIDPTSIIKCRLYEKFEKLKVEGK